MAVVGAGQFGRRHMRVIRECGRAELVAAVDTNRESAGQAAAEFGCRAFTSVGELTGQVDAAIVAVPTIAHADAGCALMEAGIDVLVEKPIAADMDSARRLVDTAAGRGRILQIGHLERFNPAIAALEAIARLPLFFEVHRMSVFTPRSLDVDVVLDLMIHDLDIVLSLTGQAPTEIRAAGISILSRKVDIANVRLAFATGCVANLTASRVSTERVRKLRLFQPREYISVDYTRQEVSVLKVGDDHQIHFQPLPIEKQEPLRLELESFLDAVESRARPRVTGEDAMRALEVALGILGKIEEHTRVVAQTLATLPNSR
jgi:predicted dehydrogenase